MRKYDFLCGCTCLQMTSNGNLAKWVPHLIECSRYFSIRWLASLTFSSDSTTWVRWKGMQWWWSKLGWGMEFCSRTMVSLIRRVRKIVFMFRSFWRGWLIGVIFQMNMKSCSIFSSRKKLHMRRFYRRRKSTWRSTKRCLAPYRKLPCQDMVRKPTHPKF
jgi:hypothetical protein